MKKPIWQRYADYMISEKRPVDKVKILSDLDLTDSQFKYVQKKARREGVNIVYDSSNSQYRYISSSSDAELETDILKKLKRGEASIVDLCNQFDKGPNSIKEIITALYNKGYNINSFIEGDIEKIGITKDVLPTKPISINPKRFFGNRVKLGFIGDNHLGSRYERLDVLNALYDIFEKEGIDTVYNTGNYIDGEARFNKHEIYVHGVDDQVKNFLEKYPHKKGITTYFIDGDDHEGWYMQREGLEVGRKVQLEAEEMGRDDLKYLGYLEADIKFLAKNGHSIMKIMHPGGGSAYAISYTPQKIVESFQEGEKPHILMLGHYHKFNYMYERGVYVVQTGTTQDQTRFMRKKKLKAHVGGGILEFTQADDGTISRLKTEWFPFYDRGFYIKKEVNTNEGSK